MLKNIAILSIFLLLWNCQTQQFYKTIKNGDIIFIEAKKENLSGAISRVTKSNDFSISYDHTGIIEVNGKTKNILHASGENGSERIPIKQFIKKNKKENRIIEVYRVKYPYKKCSNKAVEKALTMLGKPYNYLYILDENSYYCSDFVERAYRDCNIFHLNPMTFIDPSTGKTDKYWENFYQSKGISIPEGKLGCNPNGISKSEKIEKIFTLK